MFVICYVMFVYAYDYVYYCIASAPIFYLLHIDTIFG